MHHLYGPILFPFVIQICKLASAVHQVKGTSITLSPSFLNNCIWKFFEATDKGTICSPWISLGIFLSGDVMHYVKGRRFYSLLVKWYRSPYFASYIILQHQRKLEEVSNWHKCHTFCMAYGFTFKFLHIVFICEAKLGHPSRNMHTHTPANTKCDCTDVVMQNPVSLRCVIIRSPL